MRTKKQAVNPIFSPSLAALITKSPQHFHMDVMGPLIEKVQLGNAAKMWLEENPLDDAVSCEYRKIVRVGKIALERAVQSNVRLVAKYVVKVAVRRRSLGLNVSGDDLFQCGCIGLQTAINKFDLGLGLQFSTYGMHWVKQGIDREIMNYNDNQPVRLPVHLHRYIHRAARLRHQRSNQGLPPLSTNDMCDAVNASFESEGSTLPKCSYASFADAVDIVTMTLAEGNTPTMGGDGEDDGSNLYDQIGGEYSQYMSLERVDAAMDIEGLLVHLKPKESLIIKQRFIDDKTLEEVGQELGLTRERIRQIQDKALIKLNKFIDGDETAFMSAVQVRKLLQARAEEAANPKKNVKPETKFNPEDVLDGITLQIYNMRQEGIKYRVIAEELGVSISKISYQLKLAQKIVDGKSKPQKRKNVKKPKKYKAAKVNRGVEALVVEQAGPLLKRVNGVLMSVAEYRVLVNVRKYPNKSVPVRATDLKMGMGQVRNYMAELTKKKFI
ncbi:hypothetical protein MYOV003v1_p0116 [Vibrio phage 207E48.1]|nr:hypothetical protein MYOV003v1_p0116 [Vibrio phage 207E48.1]